MKNWNFTNGWRMSKVLVNYTLVLILVFASCDVLAEDEEQPSLEFLEFLGELETQDGKWIDPLLLLEVDETELKVSEKEEKKDE